MKPFFEELEYRFSVETLPWMEGRKCTKEQSSASDNFIFLKTLFQYRNLL